MIGAEEKRKLMSRFESEEIVPLIAVLKCLAAIVVLFVIAAGPWAFLAGGNFSGADVQTAAQLDQSLAESKRVFDERRRAFESSGLQRSANLEEVPAGSFPGQ